MFKKSLLVILFFLSVLSLSACYKNFQPEPDKPALSRPTASATISQSKQEISLDFSDKISTFSGLSANNVYDLLKLAVKDKYELQVGKYDFGILVESIGGYKNGEKAVAFSPLK